MEEERDERDVVMGLGCGHGITGGNLTKGWLRTDKRTHNLDCVEGMACFKEVASACGVPGYLRGRSGRARVQVQLQMFFLRK